VCALLRARKSVKSGCYLGGARDSSIIWAARLFDSQAADAAVAAFFRELQGHVACSLHALLARLVHAMGEAVVSMTEQEWARLKVEGPYPLRRGAWYRVTEFFADAVVVDVNRKPVTLPLSLLDLRGELPGRWTIVPRPTNAVRLPERWGKRYGVCPSCKSRALLRGSPQTMACPRCRGVFPVGWDEQYLHPNPTRRGALDPKG